MEKTKAENEAIVVGGGLAGLACAMKLAEQGFTVSIISVTKVKRSHSVCAQGGINAAMNLKGEDDSPEIHAYDTIKGGDALADQQPIVEMCLAGPRIIRMMERFGVPFNRTSEGLIDFRRFGGTLYTRTAFCGASTGQQLLYALDEQVRRYEVKGKIKKYEHHEFVRLVKDEEGRARGIVMMDTLNLKLQVLKADAVVFGVGGPGLIFRQSTNSTFCTGAANGRLYMQGMHYANGEFIQIHPTAIPGADKLRLISESVRGEDGRMWVWGDSNKQIEGPDGKMVNCGKTGEKWYFLEEMYELGNLVPRDIASRAIIQICEAGLGIDGKNQVYLDITEISPEKQHKLESVLEIYQKFTGEDPRKVPMRLFPAVHYSMGGAFVDYPAADDPDYATRFRQMTNIPGCFEVGESEYLYHGANRLGANSLLSCIFGGLVAGIEVPRYLDYLDERGQRSVKDPKKEKGIKISEELFTKEIAIEEAFKADLLSRNGKENVHDLHHELSNMMVLNMTVKRDNKTLEQLVDKIISIRDRYKNISLSDKGNQLNQTYLFANQFRYMIELALVMTVGALKRNESRGAHYKAQYPKRDDEQWLKHTIASYNATTQMPDITYRPVDTRYFGAVDRIYSTKRKKPKLLKPIPTNMVLPI